MCQGVVKIDQRKGKHHGLAEYLCRGRGSDQVMGGWAFPPPPPLASQLARK